jgi:hypothetical protein
MLGIHASTAPWILFVLKSSFWRWHLDVCRLEPMTRPMASRTVPLVYSFRRSTFHRNASLGASPCYICLAAYGYVRKISMLPVPFLKVYVFRSAILNVENTDDGSNEREKRRITFAGLTIDVKGRDLDGADWGLLFVASDIKSLCPLISCRAGHLFKRGPCIYLIHYELTSARSGLCLAFSSIAVSYMSLTPNS